MRRRAVLKAAGAAAAVAVADRAAAIPFITPYFNGRASFAVTRASARTTAGTQDITISGFGTPKAVRIIANRTVTSGGATADLGNSVGAADGTSQWVTSFESRDAVDPGTDPTRTWKRSATDAVALLMSTGGDGTVVFRANFDSWVTDGVRINVTSNTAAAAYELVFEFFGGSALTAKAGTQALTTQNNSVTVTPGFQTTCLFVESPQTGAFNDTSTNSILFSTGVASYDGSTIRQCSTLFREVDADPTQTLGETRTNGVATFGSARYAELATITSTQFNLTSRGADLSTYTVGYLALNFTGAAWAGVLDSPTATGDKDFTGPSFTPVFCTFRPTMLSATETDAADGTGSASGICTVTAVTQLSNHWRIRDAQASPALTDCTTETDDIAVNMGDHTGAAAFDATFSSFLSNGVRLNFTAVNGTARKWPFLFLI